jgi:membrane-associated phospholipid phosphatase
VPSGPAASPPVEAHRPTAAGRPPWWLVAAGAVVTALLTADLLAGGWVERLDERVSAVLGAWDLRDGAAYPLLWLGTQFGGRAVLAVVLLAAACSAAWRSRTARPLVQAVLALALLAAVVYAFKLGAGRTAPAFPGGSSFHRDGTSFPSGHVANAVVVWGVVRWQAVAHRKPPAVQRLTAGLAVVGPLVAGASMLVLDFHWLSDVVAGAAVGVSLLGVVHALDGVALSLWVRARAGRRSA